MIWIHQKTPFIYVESGDFRRQEVLHRTISKVPGKFCNNNNPGGCLIFVLFMAGRRGWICKYLYRHKKNRSGPIGGRFNTWTERAVRNVFNIRLYPSWLVGRRSFPLSTRAKDSNSICLGKFFVSSAKTPAQMPFCCILDFDFPNALTNCVK